MESSLQEQEFQFQDLNLDNVDASFSSFGALLSNGNVKRVKAMPEQRESLLSDMPLKEFQFEDLKLDNVDGSFPSIGALLSNGNVKRVKAMPEQRESLLSDIPLKLGYEAMDSISSSCQAITGLHKKY
ncbi:hypothetical protein GOP47_0013158 [Adiantum capillus-veneris]|uniref:Uncharacterized protein n=1 Tax=Adiantum capillus-veneris TaxID=13818 RepID=A0A9D4UNI5_ADICA|nr:hypothetical protein GOP47_0013158 [Adiantum capillus-veneris]